MLKPRHIKKVKTYFKNNLWMMVLIGLGSVTLYLLGFPYGVAVIAPTVCMTIAEIIGNACDIEDV